MSVESSERFFRDMDLIQLLRKARDPLSVQAAEAIEWLRDNMIAPSEYMRISDERGALLTEMCEARESVERALARFPKRVGADAA